MKKIIPTIAIALAIVLMLCLAVSLDSHSVARASQVETFLFDEEDGDFVVTRLSNDLEIYRSHFDESAILSAIRSVVGDGEYEVVLSAPEVEITQLTDGDKKPYSKDNLFLFRAGARHGFENLGIMGYRGADPSNGYEWRFSREGGAETAFGGFGADMPFGANNAYGEYEICAYATISLTFDGTTCSVTGRSKAIQLEIEKSDAGLPDINEESLSVSHAYGKTIEQILNDENVSSRNFALIADNKVKDKVLGVGTHGIEVEYAVGTWQGGVFHKDESVNAVKLSLTIEVRPYNVYIMLHHVTVKEGEEIRLTYEILSPSTLPNNESVDDLKLHVYGDNVGSTVGKYTIYGTSDNPNYKVYFNNYENRDNRDYSTWATLTIRPSVLSVEYEGLRYTLSRYDGFQYGDEIVMIDVYGEDAVSGAKTLKIYNDNQSVTYTDMTLTIEKVDETIDHVKVYENGVWTDKTFVDGAVTLSYSTENAGGFQVLAVKKAVEPEKMGNEVVAYALMAVLVALFLGWQGYRARKRRYPKEIYVRELRPQNEDDSTATADKADLERAEKPADGESADHNDNPKSVKKDRLTLEQKLALHPDFVPTLSLKDAFGEKEIEEDVEDDKDVDEGADEGKITFKSKMLTASVENKAIYNALKNQILAYRGIKSRVVNGGDYFRRPGKQLIKIVFIGKTIRLALALDPKDYDYNLYHQKDRGAMKKYADTPMFVKVQSPLGVRRAFKLIADLMAKEGIKWNKKYLPDDYLYDLTYGEDEE